MRCSTPRSTRWSSPTRTAASSNGTPPRPRPSGSPATTSSGSRSRRPSSRSGCARRTARDSRSNVASGATASARSLDRVRRPASRRHASSPSRWRSRASTASRSSSSANCATSPSGVERDQELAEASRSLEEAERRYRTLLENLPSITYRAGLGYAGGWEYISPQVEEVLGYTPEEWMADPDFWERAMHPDDLDRVIAEENRCAAEGMALDVEYRLRHRNGDIVWVRDRASVGELVRGRQADGRGLLCGHHRPQDGRGAAAPPRRPRRPHRPLQPPRIRARADRADGRRRARRRRRDRDHRPRPPQARSTTRSVTPRAIA